MTRTVVNASNVWKPSEVLAVELIAWYSRADNRGGYANVALFCVALAKQNWGLIQIVQNPIPDPDMPTNRRGALSEWALFHVTDTPWKAARRYASRPNSDEVDLFLTYWREEMPEWTVLTEGVRARTWTTLTGLPVPRALGPHGSGDHTRPPGNKPNNERPTPPRAPAGPSP
jgi:hypothetical protein